MVVVLTDEQRAAISAKYRISASRMAVIPNGVDVARFSGSGERRLQARPRLLFVGRLAVQKNLPMLLEALVGVSEQFDTVLVGDGPLENELRASVTRLGLTNVRFYGRADGQELVELYRTADIFVLPSEREGMPLVLLEALAMGLPIVATDVPGSRDVVIPGDNGLLVPLGDPDALRDALLTITSDGDLFRRMSASSLHLAEKYSWGSISGEFERIYSHISETSR
jgi:glycosyltransferase involved in cell wall biosynthesis